MSPVSLNYLPGPNSIQDHQSDADHLFIHNHDQPTTLSSPTTFFQILDLPQIIHNYHHQEDDKLVFEYGGSSSNYHNQVCNINNSASVEPVIVRDYENSACGYDNFYDKVGNDEEENKNVHGSDRGKYWMSSKMRLTRKMIMKKSPSTNGNSQTNPSNYNGNNSITRVCSDCHTSTTPLWRSGPKGPKSLCNACGIRQRKARRAMAEAANGSFAASMDASSTKPKVHHHKEKKSRTNHFARFKNKCKATAATAAETSKGKVKLDFKDFAINLRSEEGFQRQVFPMDEVAEAALLLMDLSCGFVYF